MLVPTPTLGMASPMELVRPVGNGGKEWTWGHWDLGEALDFLGIVGKLFLTEDCRGLWLSSFPIQRYRAGQADRNACVQLQQTTTWTEGLCNLATLRFSVSDIVSQCWSARKQLLRCHPGNQSVSKGIWSLCRDFSVSSQWQVKTLWLYNEACSQELITLLLYPAALRMGSMWESRTCCKAASGRGENSGDTYSCLHCLYGSGSSSHPFASIRASLIQELISCFV